MVPLYEPQRRPITGCFAYSEFIAFLRQEKKWWLIPLILAVAVMGAILLFSSNPVLAPLMYPFM